MTKAQGRNFANFTNNLASSIHYTKDKKMNPSMFYYPVYEFRNMLPKITYTKPYIHVCSGELLFYSFYTRIA